MRVSAGRGGFILPGEEESLVKNKTQQLARFGDPNEENWCTESQWAQGKVACKLPRGQKEPCNETSKARKTYCF